MIVWRAAAAIALIVTLGGCPPYDRVSWSPNGRYVAYVTEDNKLALWDTKTDKASPLKESDDSSVIGCHYIADDRLIVLKEHDDSLPDLLEHSDTHATDIYERNLKQGISRKLAEVIGAHNFAVSGDGAYLYYIHRSKDRFELRQRSLRKETTETTLFTCAAEISGPAAVSPSGNRILFRGAVKEEGKDHGEVFYCLTLPERGVRVAVDTAGPWVEWINEDAIAMLIETPGPGTKEQNGVCTLMVYGLKDGSGKRICENVDGMFRPSLNADRTKAAVAVITRQIPQQTPDNSREFDDASLIQIASVDLRTGEKSILTDEPFGACLSAFDPRGNRIAYQAGLDKLEPTRILDVKSKRTKLLWLNPEEKLVSDAESAAQDGRIAEAAKLYQDLLQLHPQTDLAESANYRLMMLCLRTDSFDLDKAYFHLRRYGSERIAEREELLFWRDQDRIATDPADDPIRAYGTETSEKEFGFKTDQARDLLGLWVRQSPKRLYVRVDLNAPQDVSGIALMDLVLLLNYESNEGGFDQITPLAKWDRGAQRQVRFHYWYNAGEKSQYDAEILGPTGETISRFQASGFEDAHYPEMSFMDTSACWKGAPGSMVLSFSRKALGLEGQKKVSIQACTLKGGIEEFKKLERPREVPADPRAFCDIADAFGAENTAARVDADAREKKTACAVINGCAGSFEVSEEPKH